MDAELKFLADQGINIGTRQGDPSLTDFEKGKCGFSDGSVLTFPGYDWTEDADHVTKCTLSNGDVVEYRPETQEADHMAFRVVRRKKDQSIVTQFLLPHGASKAAVQNKIIKLVRGE